MGEFQGFFCARSKTRRKQVIDVAVRLAPRKSIRSSFLIDDLSVASFDEGGDGSLHMTSKAANIVGGHCPKNDLIEC